MKTIEDVIKDEIMYELQNLSGREDFHEAFEYGVKVGVEAGVEFAEQWIKVEDELPEKVSLDVSDLVLTEDDKGVMMLERYDHDQEMFIGINYSSLEVRKVVKWRPINRL